MSLVKPSSTEYWQHVPLIKYSIIKKKKTLNLPMDALFQYLSPFILLIWAASWQNQQNSMCAQSDQSLLSAWRKLGSLATYWAHSEDADQTGRMPRLIWVFAGRTVILLVLSWDGSFVYDFLVKRQSIEGQKLLLFSVLYSLMFAKGFALYFSQWI